MYLQKVSLLRVRVMQDRLPVTATTT